MGGFTLVELLLALTLMSMLLALAYGGLRASTRAADKGQAILEDSSRIRMAHQFVRKQLNQMMPLAFVQEEGGPEEERIVFVGEPGRIRYVAPMPGYLGFGGPQVQELAVVPSEKGLALVLSHALLQGFEEPHLYERDPILLVDDVESAEFSFLALDENGEIAGWTSRWEEGSVLPEGVSLDLQFNEEVYIQWPLLTATVRLDVLEDAIVAGREGYSDAIQKMLRKSRRRE
jgi:general secretion pathway protein J